MLGSNARQMHSVMTMLTHFLVLVRQACSVMMTHRVMGVRHLLARMKGEPCHSYYLFMSLDRGL